MSVRVVRLFGLLGLCASLSTHGLLAQSRELVPRVARALAALDSAHTERGVDSLRALLGQWPQDGPTDLLVRAHIYLGAASVSLGLGDSASAHFRKAVLLNAFAVPDPEVFNPDILASFRDARRSTPTLRLGVAADTVIRPLTEGYLVAVALGRPGEVTLRLVRSGVAGAGAPSVALTVDSSSSAVLALRVSDSLPLEPGDYQLSAEMPGTGEAATARLRISRPPVDTAAPEPALDSALFRAEARKGPPVPTSALLGIAFGAGAAVVPVMLGNKDLGSGKVQIPAISVGLGISAAGIAGVALGRRMVPITENIEYNRSLVTTWEQRNRAITEANERKRRLAPLRITLVEERP